ncbi:MAG: hypothetical protein AVDCRST_MAG33-2689, partial [uncultured Thermomicrobiales bacterium]
VLDQSARAGLHVTALPAEGRGRRRRAAPAPDRPPEARHRDPGQHLRDDRPLRHRPQHGDLPGQHRLRQRETRRSPRDHRAPQGRSGRRTAPGGTGQPGGTEPARGLRRGTRPGQPAAVLRIRGDRLRTWFRRRLGGGAAAPGLHCPEAGRRRLRRDHHGDQEDARPLPRRRFVI